MAPLCSVLNKQINNNIIACFPIIQDKCSKYSFFSCLFTKFHAVCFGEKNEKQTRKTKNKVSRQMRTPYKEAMQNLIKNMKLQHIAKIEAFGEHSCTELKYNLGSLNISITF